jgi:peptide-methionine (R)-S-oxide reductase
MDLRLLALALTFGLAGPAPKQAYPIQRSDDEWRRVLSAEAFDIARKAGTERPYSGKYWNHHAAGKYFCICCSNLLFDSETKFDSGTGWPSFWAPVNQKQVTLIEDRSWIEVRTEVRCARCGAHLGHVFDDGPRPTGLRYCMNSASLRFHPKGAKLPSPLPTDKPAVGKN